jgi:GT2 family glycosyltransferase
MTNTSSVSVVSGTYNRLPFLKATVEGIRRELADTPHEIIVVDGGSTDGTLNWLPRQKDIITIVQHNRGAWNGRPLRRRSWGYFMNLGFKCSQGKYILMVSDDCLLVPGSAANGIKLFDSLLSSGRRVGAVAFYWRNWPEQRDYWVGTTLGGKLFVNHGIFLREAVANIGWIDEERYRFYYADGDLGLRLWAQGYEVVDCADAYVEHFSHASPEVRTGNLAGERQDWAAYLDRWRNIFYRPEAENIGGWIYRPFDDPHGTARRFPSPCWRGGFPPLVNRIAGILYDLRSRARALGASRPRGDR